MIAIRTHPALSDLFFSHDHAHLAVWMGRQNPENNPWPGEPDALVELTKDAGEFLELVEALGVSTDGLDADGLARDYVARL